MAEYEARKLYDVATVSSDSGTYESVWAYYIKYPGAEYSTPGRFRIRITRMSASEFMAMMGVEDDQYSSISGGYSIQGYVEKWSDKGWQQCLDWIGAPDSNNDKIEQDLLLMFESFTTGVPTNIKKSDFRPIPPAPKKPKKINRPSLIPFPSKEEIEKAKKSDKDDDPDFDWI